MAREMIIHKSFAKIMDGERQIARIHATISGTWICIAGNDYSNQLETTHNNAQQWLVAFAVASIL